MTVIYDARGNRYAVVTPQQVRQAGIALPATAGEAASAYAAWSPAAIAGFCHAEAGSTSRKGHATDGLLVGPFQDAAPFDLLIVNTDGSLAERSGNGLTIFAQALSDAGLIGPNTQFTLNVHHHGRDVRSPVSTTLAGAEHKQLTGFWLDMGAPTFGAQAVAADGVVHGTERSGIYRVPVLAAVCAQWTQSVFVRLGNPHCVTLLPDAADLPAMDWLGTAALAALSAIAFATANGVGQGALCANGINLQWAVALNRRHILARVFERGEGPTLSSGTSACAVASAMWRSGQVTDGEIEVQMPGGTAPIRLVEHKGVLTQVALFGVASKVL